MGAQDGGVRIPRESTNGPGSPLRSYRMSMLVHGFVDDPSGQGFELEGDGRCTYSVIRMHSRISAGDIVALAVVVIVLAVLFIVA